MMFCHRAAIMHDFVPSLLGGRNCFMNRIRIIHKTEYFYNQPVRFGPHRALMRPREGRDAHVARARANVEPKAEVRWLRDIYDNSIAKNDRAKEVLD